MPKLNASALIAQYGLKALVKGKEAPDPKLRGLSPVEALKKTVRGPLSPDETKSDDILSELADFVLDQEIRSEKSDRKRRPSLQQIQKELSQFHDLVKKSPKNLLRRTSNKLEPGRFYTFRYKARHHEQLPSWDTRPVILCLNESYLTHYFNVTSNNKGFLGINIHYLPIRARRKFFRDFILNYPTNKKRFLDNRSLAIEALNQLPSAYNAVGRYKALRQYLRAGQYVNVEGKDEAAGAFEIVQIPYALIIDALAIPSPYEGLFAVN